jgi:hypothetical protein
MVKAMWESTVGATALTSDVESGDPNHTSWTAPMLTQVAPKPGFQATTDVIFWAVVTDPAGVGNVANVYADVYYPTGTVGVGVDPGPSGSLKFEVKLALATTDEPAVAMFDAANAAHMVTINANTPLFPAGTGTQVGDIEEELNQQSAKLYWGIFPFDNCELAGNYPVIINAKNTQNVTGTLTNTVQWLPIAGAAFDFTTVNYGSVAIGIDKQIDGDRIWNTSMTGSNPASVENIGNTYLQVTVNQSDMGFGVTQPGNVPNVSFDARLGDGDTGNLPNEGKVFYNPNVTTTIPQILKLCAITKVDFSIIVVKDPSMTDNHTYSGTMTLGAISATGPAFEGTEYMPPATAPTARKNHSPTIRRIL